MTEQSSVERVPDSELDYDENLIYTWNGMPFTGIGYDGTQADGLSEITYRNGAQSGPARDYFPGGSLKYEAFYLSNSLHGSSTEYGESGHKRELAQYEYGIRVFALAWDESGEVVSRFEIDKESPAFARLKHHRSTLAWPIEG